MKVVVAMDSYKGCLTAREACQAIVCGIKQVVPQCHCIEMPVSDGGDGMLSTISCEKETISVSGPLPSMIVNATIGFAGNTAIIESAQACGLSLLSPEQRNPLLTSTKGVGEMILHAIKCGCKRIILGLGGSSTNDLGTGMLSALGVEFYDNNGEIVAPCGGNIGIIHELSNTDTLATLLDGTEITAACDVNNPLCGSHGAAHVYAPQKGANASMVQQLENGAISLSKIMGEEIALKEGAGAAGGLGYALMALCNCRMASGASLVLELLDFDSACRNANLVITGEGRSDSQTLMGKIPAMVMEMARKQGIPTALLSGRITNEDELKSAGFYSVKTVSPLNMPLEKAMEKDVASHNLESAAKELITQIALSMQV